ncbi:MULTISPECIES: histidine kinase [unclassified Beijerinckia]|uniref:PAS domain-containing sensor histidine kinase n=1 Tax=unclassified Beijerinckia TaxID=2638183 RepID=UPI000897DAAA|nr:MULTISPECIES: histidine kinase [unclassified Beijerinckia]MDH7796133.1 PAS domain S-box-containing protein [Beijerinckia sp. GAS462]SEC31756.1 PAS domain S-box-containing protein [Beijerinckia sp. 28-YEA-48]
MNEAKTAEVETALAMDHLVRKDLIGLATISADLDVIARHGHLSAWLPADGSCLQSMPLFGLKDEMLDMQRSGAVLSLPTLHLDEVSTENPVVISILWDAGAGSYTALTFPDRGAGQIQQVLEGERRSKQIAEEQMAAERQAARRGEARYRDIVETSSDFVVRLDEDLAVTFANQRLHDFLGRGEDALLSQRIDLLLGEAEEAGWARLRDAQRPRAEPVSFEAEAHSTAAASVWIWWSVSWLPGEGGPGEFQAIGRDVTLLRQLRAHVQQAHEEARSAAIVRERLRIARDLHDTLVQSMVTVLTQLRLARRLVATKPNDLPEELAIAEAGVETGLNEARKALSQVRLQLVDEEGLGGALKRLGERVAQRAGLDVSLAIDPDSARLTGPSAEAIFRISEEATRNVEIHAGAKTVRIVVRQANGGSEDAERIQMEIVDDGVGFDPALVPERHFGIIGMKEQVALRGGDFEIWSRPGQGVRLTLSFPVDSNMER